MEETNMDTLDTVLRSVERNGFETQFKITQEGLLSLRTHHLFQPNQIQVIHFYRFEGASNQDDNAILYAIKTCDQEKGTLVDGYGSSADFMVADFMKQVRYFHK